MRLGFSSAHKLFRRHRPPHPSIIDTLFLPRVDEFFLATQNNFNTRATITALTMSKTARRLERGPTPVGQDSRSRSSSTKPITNPLQISLPSRPKPPINKPLPARPRLPTEKSLPILIPISPKPLIFNPTIDQPVKPLPIPRPLRISNTRTKNRKLCKQASLTSTNLSRLSNTPSSLFTYLYNSSASERVALGLPRWHDAVKAVGEWEERWSEFC